MVEIWKPRKWFSVSTLGELNRYAYIRHALTELLIKWLWSSTLNLDQSRQGLYPSLLRMQLLVYQCKTIVGNFWLISTIISVDLNIFWRLRHRYKYQHRSVRLYSPSSADA